MASNSFTTAILVDQPPMAAFDAINRPRNWWGKEIEGRTDRLGEEWTYRYKDMHVSKQRTTEFVPGRRVVWHVIDAQMNFLKDKSEWKNTDLIFDIARKGDKTEIRFTHAGLVPEVECFDVCTNAWTGLIADSLKGLIESEQGLPDTVE
ncbi:SRPBCC domain-containing protein [Mesorhizobium sp. YC-39]|uniref:SRPBCC family protein n=1 Tax=unclassified Mesorhizobium TaxID=325217 RepID=UPI0021E8AF2C|nr:MULTISPECIES: SRPBCC domain-containing protein [unclassified Mesorhizobium]MCV3206225.1 SRPBCC domain-containing protein [Mesorhizobium sp. YC-2]MCV3227375.1 SRPBCC domain-containing protein [Mesorhizobium sp. YC-39]